MKNIKRGFTLIELLVVIVIIGILATIVTTSFLSAQAKSRDTRRISDLQAIKTAILMYKDEHKAYPPNLPTKTIECYVGSPAAADNNCLIELVNEDFIDQLPINPKQIPGDFGQYYGYYDYGDNKPVVLSTRLEKYNGTGMPGTWRHDAGTFGSWCLTGVNDSYCLNLR